MARQIEKEPGSATTPLILVVEDEHNLCSVIGGYLAERGYRVALAPDRSSAENILRTDRPALMIADMVMPGGGIFELAATARPTGVPVLFISGEPTKVYRMEGGPVPFLHKPFRLADLEREVYRLLSAK